MALDHVMARICARLQENGWTLHVFKSGRVEIRDKQTHRLISSS